MNDLDRLIPHRPPMRLIDAVKAVDGTSVHAVAIIANDHLFVESGVVPGWVAIEIMAQATAAIGGFRALDAGGRGQPGYLLGCRGFTFDPKGFRVDAELDVRATELMSDGALAMYQVTVDVAGVQVASARLNIHTGTING